MNDKYIFFFNTGYQNGEVKEEVSAEDIGIKEGMNEEEKEKLLSEYYIEWLGNFDTGWYSKDQE